MSRWAEIRQRTEALICSQNVIESKADDFSERIWHKNVMAMNCGFFQHLFLFLSLSLVIGLLMHRMTRVRSTIGNHRCCHSRGHNSIISLGLSISNQKKMIAYRVHDAFFLCFYPPKLSSASFRTGSLLHIHKLKSILCIAVTGRCFFRQFSSTDNRCEHFTPPPIQSTDERNKRYECLN